MITSICYTSQMEICPGKDPPPSTCWAITVIGACTDETCMGEAVITAHAYQLCLRRVFGMLKQESISYTIRTQCFPLLLDLVSHSSVWSGYSPAGQYGAGY